MMSFCFFLFVRYFNNEIAPVAKIEIYIRTDLGWKCLLEALRAHSIHKQILCVFFPHKDDHTHPARYFEQTAQQLRILHFAQWFPPTAQNGGFYIIFPNRRRTVIVRIWLFTPYIQQWRSQDEDFQIYYLNKIKCTIKTILSQLSSKL